MKQIELHEYQKDAIAHMKNGCILCSKGGSGKSRTAIGYYYVFNGGDLDKPEEDVFGYKPLYILTTATKRDKKEWEPEISMFEKIPVDQVVIDSWNNIGKYRNVVDSFFIFDEQRAVGRKKWARTLIRIARRNRWIMLSATPGDKWYNYATVFIANGFYKNYWDFDDRHVVYSRNVPYPKPDKYLEEDRLERLRDNILVDMDSYKDTHPVHITYDCEYDKYTYKQVTKTKWDPYKQEYIENASAYCYLLRKIVNSDPSRAFYIRQVVYLKKKVIIFYNFNYELDILRGIDYGEGVEVAELNGQKHDPLPTGESWVYLVQYIAGAEGWNCITTDTIIFYSMNYSWRTMQQAQWRTDRANSPYQTLYYYHLRSNAPIDKAIMKALDNKEKFNERAYMRRRRT